MESIGDIIKQEREKRGLSVREVHEATKITPQNISALEEDRFDYFPNKVYARAFLRDYANFLGLDSAALLTRYESEWNVTREPDVAPVVSGPSAWRTVGYVFLSLIVLGVLAVTGYFGWTAYEKKGITPTVPVASSKPHKEEVATLPKPVAPAKPEATPKPAVPEPEVKPAPVSDKLTLQVALLAPVWVRVRVDGQKAFEGVLAKGDVKTFEAKKNINIRAGMAGAVQLKLNGQLQPPLGTMKSPGEKTFTMPEPAATPAPAIPAPSGGSAKPAGSATR